MSDTNEDLRAALPADCRACGACCSGLLVEVDDAALAVLPRRLVKQDDLFGWVMRERKGVCAALRGEIGCGVSCSVYDSRPLDCRDFEPGCRACLDARSRAARGVEEVV